MATRKVTITLPEEQLDEIRQRVATGAIRTVSGYVQHAVKVALSEEQEFEDMIHQMLEDTGGPLTDEERAWARSIIQTGKVPEEKTEHAA